MQRRTVRPGFDQLDGRGTVVQLVRDAPPEALVQMGPVEPGQAELDVAQPSRLAGPGSTGDIPDVVESDGGNGPVNQTARHHVLPHGRQRADPGTPAHQVGLGPLEDDHVVAGPVQERRCRASGDRSPDDADSHAGPPSTSRGSSSLCAGQLPDGKQRRRRSYHGLGPCISTDQACPQPHRAPKNRANVAGRGTTRLYALTCANNPTITNYSCRI